MARPIVNLKSKTMLPRYSEEDIAWLAKRVGLAPEQLKDIQHMAHATYQYIGGDLEGPHKREDLIEVLLDANYLEVANQRNVKLTPEIKEWLHKKALKYPLDHVYQAIGAAFPFASYE